MSIRYLIDENLEPLYKTQLLLKQPELVVYAVGEPGAPPKGTKDPDILYWCEANKSVLITNNRKSMPDHLTEHLAQGRHIPGIITLNPDMSIGATIDELVLIAIAANPDDFQDRIAFLPIP